MIKKSLEVYLVSDSSGETVIAVSKATVVQFPDTSVSEHLFLLVRSKKQVDEIIAAFQKNPGVIIYTMGNSDVKDYFLFMCEKFNIPVICPIDAVTSLISENTHLIPSDTKPGKYKSLNKEYYEKIDSINFSITHDDGQHAENYEQADIVLLGVSRTSKSPIALYLGQRGYKVANYPIILNLTIQIPYIEKILQNKKPLLVGLTISPYHLARVRSHRLSMLYDEKNIESAVAGKFIENQYVSDAAIQEELAYAQALFQSLQIPVLDVTSKAIEESAAAIINLYNKI